LRQPDVSFNSISTYSRNGAATREISMSFSALGLANVRDTLREAKQSTQGATPDLRIDAIINALSAIEEYLSNRERDARHTGLQSGT
jgi:hypothetical protein